MTLQGAVEALCNLQSGLVISKPFTATIKAAYALPPNRAQSGLPDDPAWINVWGLTEVMNWGQLRIERYTITSQLLVNDADSLTAAAMATSFSNEFIRAWDEVDGDLEGQTVGTVLRARDPTIVNLEWGGMSYSGLQYLIDIDVPVIATPTYQDDVITTLRNWTLGRFPNWQQDPATWRPSDANPAIYWHYVTLAGPLENDYISFDYGWQGAVVAARIVAPSRIARTMHTTRLSQMLGHDMLDYMAMPDGSWMQFGGLRAEPYVPSPAEGQLQMNVKFILDQSLDPEDWWSADPPSGTGGDPVGEFGPTDPGDPDTGGPGGAVLEWREDPSVGDGHGPTIIVKPPTPSSP